MFRKGIIVATIVAVILGSVGLPMNVHSCAMKGEATVAPTCGMCAKHHAEKKDNPAKKGCCDNRTEIKHTDPASSLKAGFSVPAPMIVAVLAWFIPSFEPIAARHSVISLRSHSPPSELRKQTSYLFNSSFLI